MPTFATNGIVKAEDLNQLRDGVNFLNTGLPHCYARQALNTTTVQQNTWTTIAFDTVEVDADNGLDSQGTYHCGTTGWYYIVGNITWPWLNPSSGNRGTRLVLNTTAVVGTSILPAAPSIVHGGEVNILLHMMNGDQMQVQGFQDQNSTMNTILNYQPFNSQTRSETTYMSLLLIKAG
ncbi:hypothetical protein ACFVUS_12495 [Nocardia sp. NPDC058058]|uniref:hypothetical protein n=1 Tax=Nocardia sp. NPDC058058 TaxID=3346317 RepID=UPI0036D85603